MPRVSAAIVLKGACARKKDCYYSEQHKTNGISYINNGLERSFSVE